MFQSVRKSLKDILGTEYCEQVIRYNTVLYHKTREATAHLTEDTIDFFPELFENELNGLLPLVGKSCLPPFDSRMDGAATDSYRKATHLAMSPVGGKGFYRLGEDGRLYFIGKSEHYHVPLGHNFPGYRLLRNARDLGIVNPTHNNTRGYITRLLEQELVRVANGVAQSDPVGLKAVLESSVSHTINRVINLETGSLAVEAGLKMMLSRFYRLDESFSEPKYGKRTPVFFVVADDFGGRTANYHGTTMLLQTTRGLWPELSSKLAGAGIFDVVPVRINDIDDFRARMREYDTGSRKVAGFLHEIVLMNYGAVTLTRDYLQAAYEICHQQDVPVLVDEIQSCIWYKNLFLFRDYGLNPDFVIIGKGFPGGEYSASKVLTTKEMDNLNQFGALVTNGQEEMASLSYLITMEFALSNAQVTSFIGQRYTDGLRELAAQYPSYVDKIEGLGHLAAVHFHDIEPAACFANLLNDECIDVSIHGYKEHCLPAVLTKLPLITTEAAVDFILGKMRAALEALSSAGRSQDRL